MVGKRKGRRCIGSQKWADDHREPEAQLCEKANGIKYGVAHMACSEERDHTREYHSALTPLAVWRCRDISEEVLNDLFAGISKAEGRRSVTRDKTPARPPKFERVLFRFVFSDIGRSLLDAKDTRELLEGLWDGVKGTFLG